MAASAEDKDYIHIVVDSVASLRGTKPKYLAVNIADFERGYVAFDTAERLKEEIAFKPDTIILCIGENVSTVTNKVEQVKFKNSIVQLLSLFKGDGKNAIYVRSSFWPDSIKDQVMKDACWSSGGVFVDISSLSKDEHNYARSERKFSNEGVGNHPGDAGMRAIADAIFSAMKQ